MQRLLIAAALVSLAAPIAAHAQQLPFQPAPVPNVDPGLVTPSLRAGSASDAGPTNSSPFSGEASTVLTGTEAARSLRVTRPEVDPAPTEGVSEQ